MIDFGRNNLDMASSPYLRQHADNPVHWQEWSEKALVHARTAGRLVLVSIGYATCHWCHVMAAEAFSDRDTADFINQHYVAVKVDREQRPDIDGLFMDFVTRTTGSGGWPLNVVLSPEGNPFFGGTYFPRRSQSGLPSFLEVLRRVKSWHDENGDRVVAYTLAHDDSPGTTVRDDAIALGLMGGFDEKDGGFGRGMKFPPHATLLLLLHFGQATGSEAARDMVRITLDAMMNRGLHDHLQGGFFRYCVDRRWQIPHFEKMLYDQAMHLWVYSLAVGVFGCDRYRRVVHKIIRCLKETFATGDGLFVTAHDADTDHLEGATYLWTPGEIRAVLGETAFKRFSATYTLSEEGNFEGRNHLIKRPGRRTGASPHRVDAGIEESENRLLEVRRKRSQPFVDGKIISGWNALAGIGLVMA